MSIGSREQVETVLSAAAIRPERRGAARVARLTGPERTLYHRLLRSFAAGNAFGADALRAEAVRHGLDPNRALSTLAADDLVHTDERGEITVAYPFPGRPTTHRPYLNFPGLGAENEELVRAGYGVNYDRLAALKAKYDPTNLSA